MTLAETIASIASTSLSDLVASVRVVKVGVQGPPGLALATPATAGALYPGVTYTNNGDGTITVHEASWQLYSNANFSGVPAAFTIAEDTFAPAEGVSFIVADYNGGVPIYAITTNVLDINESDVLPAITVTNDGTVLHPVDWDSMASGMPNKLHKRFVKTDRFANESGNALSEDGARHLTITAGRVWLGAHEFSVAEIDTSIATLDATGPTLFYFWQKDGPTSNDWSFTFVQQYSNGFFNPQTGGLTALGSQKYTVVWVYRDLDSSPHAAYVLHDEEYTTIAGASAAQPRTDLPSPFNFNGQLIGRVIIRKDENTGVVESAFESDFVAGPISDHESLANLLGGDVAGHYHNKKAVNDAGEAANSPSASNALATADDVAGRNAYYAAQYNSLGAAIGVTFSLLGSVFELEDTETGNWAADRIVSFTDAALVSGVFKIVIPEFTQNANGYKLKIRLSQDDTATNYTEIIATDRQEIVCWRIDSGGGFAYTQEDKKEILAAITGAHTLAATDSGKYTDIDAGLTIADTSVSAFLEGEKAKFRNISGGDLTISTTGTATFSGKGTTLPDKGSITIVKRAAADATDFNVIGGLT